MDRDVAGEIQGGQEADRFTQEVNHWQEEARRYCENADYWRQELETLKAKVQEFLDTSYSDVEGLLMRAEELRELTK